MVGCWWLILFIVWIWLGVGFCGLVVFVLVGVCVFLLCDGFDVLLSGLGGFDVYCRRGRFVEWCNLC